MKIIKKAYICWCSNNTDSYCREQELYADSANEAKVKHLNSYWEDGSTYISIRAKRNPSQDIVDFEGEQDRRYLVEDSIERKKWRQGLEALAKANPNAKCRIYSGQWHSFWRENAGGYTANPQEAGIYTVKDAFERVHHCGTEKKIELQLIN